MKFKTGFLVGAAAGLWAAKRAGVLDSRKATSAVSAARAAGTGGVEQTAEKLRALSGLARERVIGMVDGPIGEMTRGRLADLLGASFGDGSDSPIETSARAR